MKLPDSRIESSGKRPNGLALFPGFLPVAEQEEIMAWIRDNVSWAEQEYLSGNRAENYQEGPSSERPYPPWAARLAKSMTERGIFAEPPEHMHLLRYEAGAGMAPHVDRRQFGAVIAGLTLGSSRVFEFKRDQKASGLRMLLLPGDLYVFRDEARYLWKHGIPAQPRDEFRGKIYERSAGISITWRNISRSSAARAKETGSGRFLLSWLKRR